MKPKMHLNLPNCRLFFPLISTLTICRSQLMIEPVHSCCLL